MEEEPLGKQLLNYLIRVVLILGLFSITFFILFKVVTPYLENREQTISSNASNKSSSSNSTNQGDYIDAYVVGQLFVEDFYVFYNKPKYRETARDAVTYEGYSYRMRGSFIDMDDNSLHTFFAKVKPVLGDKNKWILEELDIDGILLVSDSKTTTNPKMDVPSKPLY